MRVHSVPLLRLLPSGLILLALTTGACRRHPPSVSRRVAKASAKPTAGSPAEASAPPAAGQPAERVGTLIHVPDKQMPSLPKLFDVSGRFVAVPDKQDGCDLWDLPAQAYVGHVDKAGCARITWVTPRCLETAFDEEEEHSPSPDSCAFRQAGEHPLRSADGEWVARINGAALSIDHAGKTVTSRAGCAKEECRDILAAAFSPDGTQLAVARKQGTQIFVVDSATGKTAKGLKLAAGDILLPDMLGWGPGGLAVLVGKAKEKEKEKKEDSAPAAGDKPGEGGDADAEATAAAASPLEDVDSTQLLFWHSPSAHPARYTNDNKFPFATGGRRGTFLMS